MTTQTNFHHAKRAEVWALESSNHALQIYDEDNNNLTIYVPPHVAEHTASAFNRAMQAVPTYQRGEYQYTTDRQIWWITFEPGFGWRGQSDEITGDGDPAWMFADASTLIGVMDEIDAQEEDNGCQRCADMPGLDNLHEIGRGRDMEMICDDCAKTEAQREQELREMAADDKAHAQMERAAE